MLQQENQTQSANFEWACQALSATGEPCDTSDTCHCGVCGKWLCAVHAVPGELLFRRLQGMYHMLHE